MQPMHVGCLIQPLKENHFVFLLSLNLCINQFFSPGEEEKPINFNVKDVFDVTRKVKVLVSNLEEEYNEFIPQAVLDKYRKMLTGGSSGEHLGIMVKSIGRHRLMEQREESEDDSDEKILPM